MPSPEDDPRKKQAMKRKRRKAKKEEDRAAGRVPEKKAKKPKKVEKDEVIQPADSVEKDLQKASAEDKVKVEEKKPVKELEVKSRKIETESKPSTGFEVKPKPEKKEVKPEKVQKPSKKVSTPKKQKSNKILWVILGIIVLIYVIYKVIS